MRHPRRRCALVLVPLLLSVGCTPAAAPANDQDIVENAINGDLNIVDADDDRADRLEEKATELRSAARTADRTTGSALRNEAAADEAAAGAIRAQGTDDGAQSEDHTERNAGLLNTN